MVMTPLAGMTRAEAVVQHVRGLINERGLAPGELIGTKTDIRETVGVAKATMNEAVRLLESQGIVTVRPGPGGGLFVARHDPVVRLGQSLLTVSAEPVSVADAVIVRELLEPQIIADAARYRTNADIARMVNGGISISAIRIAGQVRPHARQSPTSMMRALTASVAGTFALTSFSAFSAPAVSSGLRSRHRASRPCRLEAAHGRSEYCQPY